MEGENKVKQSAYYPGKYSEAEWENAWLKLQTTNEWDLDYFGDLVIISCAHSLRKDILVINTPWRMASGATAHGPINVALSDALVSTNKASTEIPIVLAYDGQHFESLIPTSNEDIEKTIKLTKAFKNGRYKVPASLQCHYGMKIMLTQEKQDHATNFQTVAEKRNTNERNTNESNSSDDFESEWKTVTRKKKCTKATIRETNIASTKSFDGETKQCVNEAKKWEGKSDENGEKAFIKLQQRVNEILEIPTKNRSDQEKKEYNSLRNKYSKGKLQYPHLVQKKLLPLMQNGWQSTDKKCPTMKRRRQKLQTERGKHSQRQKLQTEKGKQSQRQR